ncbi:sugar-binding protein [Gorillibacterium sp. sgz5001074]|uniref:sugar-binding protein n=1 Tax=Gorillibacterium sp. sgz5001074 TaxID=3446695 RepID=UPI003F67630D
MRGLNKATAMGLLLGMLVSQVLGMPQQTHASAGAAVYESVIKYEAENGILTGATAIQPDAGASGGRMVGHFNGNGDGLTFKSLSAGTKLTVYYAALYSGTISLYINNQKAGTLSVPGTNSWIAPYQAAEKAVSIPAGATVTLQRDAYDTGINIDYITITQPESTVPFDAKGKYTDSLDSLNHTVTHSGITQSSGSISGPGDLVYSAGTAGFKSISLETTFNKWSLNYNGKDLSVYEAVYDASSGAFTNTKQVPLVRELRPNLMENKDVGKAVYISGPITPGTRYLRVVLPDKEFFQNEDPAHFPNFKVDSITMTNSAAAGYSNTYMVDDLSGFTRFAPGANTDNLYVTDLTAPDKIWDARTFAASHFMERKSATVADQGMTYAAPEGKELNSVYAEGYYNFAPPSLFEIWTSADGVNFVPSTQNINRSNPTFLNNGQWLPFVVNIPDLPTGTRYAQIRLPAYAAGELYGMKHPRMTQVALGYGEPGTGNPVPTDPSGPKETVIAYTDAPLIMDGIVETDGDSGPVGEWAGASSAVLAGTVDTNGDSHSAVVFLKYDYEKLYIGAKIKDPTPMQNTNTGGNIWNGDNLELFLGTEDLDFSQYPDKKLAMLPSDVQVVLSGGMEQGPQFYLYQNGVFSYPNIEMNVRPDANGKGYTIEASIPLHVLGITDPWDHKRVILNPVLNDGAMPKRGQYGWTTTDEPTKKSRSLWGSADLEPTLAPAAGLSVAAAVDALTGAVTVTGTTYQALAKDVTILVKNSGGYTAYLDQARSDSLGRFSFTFPINGEVFGGGRYTVLAGGDGIDRPGSTVFDYTPVPEGPAAVSASLTTDAAVLQKGSVLQATAGLERASGVSAVEMEIRYDPLLFSYVAGSAAPADPNSAIVDSQLDEANGSLRFVLARLGPDHTLSGSAPVLTLRFTAIGASGQGKIEVARTVVSNPQGALTSAAVNQAIVMVTVMPETTPLLSAIIQAQNLYDHTAAGMENGNVPPKAKEALLASLTSAQAAAHDPASTPDRIAQALSALTAAVSKFQSLVITVTTGDFGSPGYDLSEIGIMAGSYGVKANDAGWNPAYDLDGDGEVGDYELVFVAKRFHEEG